MFKTIEPLDHEKHKDLRLTRIPSFSFAKKTSIVKLAASELRSASRYFPIIFLADAPGVPQALLSLEPGKNVFINGDGVWAVPYIPAFFRFYPFSLARIGEKADQYALCLDPDAEHFKPGMGDPLFTAEGKPTDFIGHTVLKNLETYQKELQVTQALFNVLEEKSVIVDQELKITVNGREKRINGFRSVNFEKLTALDDAALAGMVRNGTMGMALEQISSIANISGLVTVPQDPLAAIPKI